MRYRLALEQLKTGRRSFGSRQRDADARTLSELRDKLEALEETRMTAERELALLEGRCETLRALEADKDRLLKAYTSLALEALSRRSLAWRLDN